MALKSLYSVPRTVFRYIQAGIDTIGLRYLTASNGYPTFPGHLSKLAYKRLNLGGVEISVSPHGVVFVEGTVRSLLGEDDGGRLCSVEDLIEAAGRVDHQLQVSFGLQPVGPPDMVRCDIAVDTAFPTVAEGRQALLTLHRAPLPRLNPALFGSALEPEGIWWTSNRGKGLGSVLLRAYGRPNPTADERSSTVVRIERQARYKGDRGIPLHAVQDKNLAEVFWKPYLARGAEYGDVVVCDSSQLGDVLAAAIRAARIAPGEARRIAGSLIVGDHDLGRTAQRDLARLMRKAGVAFGHSPFETWTFPLSEWLVGCRDAIAAALPIRSGASA